MDYDNLKLENQLCFPLYATAKEVVRRYKPYLDEIGLTYTQYIAMMVLWEHQTINIKALGDYLYLDSGTLTPLLKRLESAGFVERKRDPDDERTVVVSLTAKGNELKTAARPIPEKIKQCFSISPEEALTLYRLLYKILGVDPASQKPV